MAHTVKQAPNKLLGFIPIGLLLIFCCAAYPPTQNPITVSARMTGGVLVYRVNGKTVEDSKENSLLTNLTEIVKERGTEMPVFLIIDVHASFVEVGKLETALDKVELTKSRRLFVANFQDATMNEIHWDQSPVPIPRD